MTNPMRIVICLALCISQFGCKPNGPSAHEGGQSYQDVGLTPAERAEFEQLRAFYVTYLRSVDRSILGLPGMGDPEAHLQLPIAESASREEFEGLKQGVNTLLYLNSYESSAADTRRADQLLLAVGAPSLSELLANYREHSDEILRRGYIKDDTEFYLVREIADENPEFYPLLEHYEFGTPLVGPEA